jgi:hypothetical protein
MSGLNREHWSDARLAPDRAQHTSLVQHAALEERAGQAAHRGPPGG